MDLFNTSTVSVELHNGGTIIDPDKFQYFNCIGGIYIERLDVNGAKLFQYFNCIGGILCDYFHLKQLCVSILQLYRWNQMLRLLQKFDEEVSILQLYRWNKRTCRTCK